ncbi:MAG: LysR family transcriptional regulator substrate-binding protein, partial [Pseudomonadota bacterium]|nr:LysR family transcriptional regulator substrate-binding protein [Pseudomonadota bacterium]
STNPLESIRMLVSMGLGWSALPQTLMNADLHILTISDAGSLQRRLGLVWHPDRTRSSAAQALVDWVNTPSEAIRLD